MQSFPVSPPPMTTTSLPRAMLARSASSYSLLLPLRDICFDCHLLRKLIAKWMPLSLRPSKPGIQQVNRVSCRESSLSVFGLMDLMPIKTEMNKSIVKILITAMIEVIERIRKIVMKSHMTHGLDSNRITGYVKVQG